MSFLFILVQFFNHFNAANTLISTFRDFYSHNAHWFKNYLSGAAGLGNREQMAADWSM